MGLVVPGGASCAAGRTKWRERLALSSGRAAPHGLSGHAPPLLVKELGYLSWYGGGQRSLDLGGESSMLGSRECLRRELMKVCCYRNLCPVPVWLKFSYNLRKGKNY